LKTKRTLRWLMGAGLLLVLGSMIYIQHVDISRFLFSNLPTGVGLSKPVAGLLVLFCSVELCIAIYFGLIRSDNAALKPISCTNLKEYFTELRVRIIFGTCFGVVAGIFCSLIFVIFETDLPEYFLQYHQLFAYLNIPLICLGALLSGIIYLWGLMLPMLLAVNRLSNRLFTEPSTGITIFAVVFSAFIGSLIFALMIAGVTTEWSFNLAIFSVIVSWLTFSYLGFLFWLVGIESSLIANIVYCLLVSYLAQIFL
jgi:hypothetical protein